MTNDLNRIAEDDQLLDALGRGETPAGADRVAALLGEWRAALPETVSVPARPTRRRVRRSLVAAAVVLIAAGGVTAAAEHAEPDSPLWPVTRLLYSDLADSRAARQAADEAVTVAAEAIEGGRYGHATDLLDQADALVAQVDDPSTAEQLRSRIATVRAQIATATAEVTDGAAEGTPEVPLPPPADPPPTGAVSPPPVTPEPAPGDRSGTGREHDPGHEPGGGPGNRPVDPPGHGPPPGVLPTVPGVPIPEVDPGK